MNPVQHMLTFTTLKKRPSENIIGKGENAGKHHFLLLPQSFQPNQQQKSPFLRSFKLHFLTIIAFSSNKSKILSFGKYLK